MFGLDPLFTILLLLCLLAALSFEFINGFHDTANAVASVIYTHSLKPVTAVIWTGIWNFIGVYVGGIAVAIGIINLLPLEMLVDQSLGHSIAMIFALILTAIAWNLATWYFGIPCSSSHTLIGSIFGVGLAFTLLPGNGGVDLNWTKVADAGLSLLISPLIGFYLAFLLMMLLKKTIRKKAIFMEPPDKKAPPFWIRSILILTSTGVSYAHGSNDGQKGIGLVMLILIGFAPTYFTIDRQKDPSKLIHYARAAQWTMDKIDQRSLSDEGLANYLVIQSNLDSLLCNIKPVVSGGRLSQETHLKIRKEILTISKNSDLIIKDISKSAHPAISRVQLRVFRDLIKQMRSYTEYAPKWVILLVSIALGLGTMIGWKRIVTTIGERIGKTKMTYAQGASANMVAAGTILMSSFFGLPVSTTHVLSSGVAGTMIVGKGKKNLQKKTVRSVLISWIVTLPVTIILSALLFLLFRLIWA